MADVPLLGKPVHNEIVFIKDGNVLLSFNGDAYNRKTGELRPFSPGGEDSLRVRALPISLKDLTAEYPLIAETTLANLSQEEFLQKMGRAVEASEFINAQNLNYIILGAPFGSGSNFDAQNSNSVASTLTAAMDFKMPASVSSLWAPGQSRVLLPEGWDPLTRDMKPEEVITYLNQHIEGLSEENVGKKVKSDPDPNKPELYESTDFPRPPSQIFFNPKMS